MTDQGSDSLREQRRLNRERRRDMLRERRRQQRIKHCQNMRHADKSWLGIGIIVVGLVWLLRVLDVPMPDWIFTWPSLLVVAGIFSGLASRFRNMGSLVLIVIGLVFLARNSVWPNTDLTKYIVPVLLIFVGFVFLVKRHDWEKRAEWVRRHHPDWEKWHEKGYCEADRDEAGIPRGPGPAAHAGNSGRSPEQGVESGEAGTGGIFGGNTRQQAADDWIDITTILGGARRTVISKNFRGGDLTNICGGTILDLTHADINGIAVIDVVGLWGGVKVAVPPNWEVRMNVTHLMAGTEDRRRSKGADPEKILVFTGTLLMAGIEIADTA